jgi:hypothetical protein
LASSFFSSEATPIPFEKDDDFQIDFIAATTVSFLNDYRIIYSEFVFFALEFKSTNVWS